MQDTEKINETVEPIYEQFERLGNLYEDGALAFGFLRAARRVFGKQYAFELKLLLKAENRTLRHDFRMVKKQDKWQFKRERNALHLKEKAKRSREHMQRKLQKKAKKEARKAERAARKRKQRRK